MIAQPVSGSSVLTSAIYHANSSLQRRHWLQPKGEVWKPKTGPVLQGGVVSQNSGTSNVCCLHRIRERIAILDERRDKLMNEVRKESLGNPPRRSAVQPCGVVVLW
jgi:hypothetical protein